MKLHRINAKQPCIHEGCQSCAVTSRFDGVYQGEYEPFFFMTDNDFALALYK